MDTANVRHGVAARLSEAREALRHVRETEQLRGPLNPLPAFETSLRGLVYVQLYGALEYCVTTLAQDFVSYVSQKQVQHRDIDIQFNAIALDPELTSLATRGEKGKWAARRALFEKLFSSEPVTCNEGAFSSSLQNISPHVIQEVFSCFSISKSPTAEPRHLGYLAEITDKRNAVAHGRQTAAEAAEGKTTADLEILLITISEVCTYVTETVEAHATSLSFIQSRARAAYMAA